MSKIFAFIFVFILLSCNQKQENQQQQAEIPKALQENRKSGVEIYAKRVPEDLVEELYREKLKSSPALQEIERSIRRLREAERDSLENYYEFKQKNEEYYSSAKRHISSLGDSSLKKQVLSIIESSLARYNNNIKRLNDLVEILNNKNEPVNDRKTAMMVLISLESMEKFQQNKLPATKAVESVINEYNTLIRKMDSIITKKK